MENVILIIGVMIFFILGFHIMKRVDLFINENDKRISKDIKIKEPSSVRLSGDLPLIEIDKEIDKFRQNHHDFEIILKDDDKDY